MERATSGRSLWSTADILLPQNWVHLLVGVEPKDTTKPKSGRRRHLLPEASKENTGDLSQSSVSPNGKIVEVLSYGYMHIHEEAWAVYAS